MKNHTRNNVDLKQNNIRDIIGILKVSPDITKNEIAEKMSMTLTSAHNFISELLEKGICISSGTVAALSSGRRSVKYRLNKNYGYIIGVKLARASIRFTAYDIGNGNDPLAEKTYACDIHDRESATDRLLSGTSEFMSERALKNKKCLSMGIAIPGRADKNGRIVRLPDAGIWRGCPLKEIFEQKFGIPAYVDNDNNAHMLAAKWLGLISGEANAVFFSIDDGAGMSAMNSRELFRGAQDNGPEIGHTIVYINGNLCRCGNKGCLEAYLTEQAIYDSMSYLLESKYRPFLEQSPTRPSVAQIAAYAKKNKCYDLYAAFSKVSDYITVALQNIISIFDPATIIISSEWLRFLPEISNDIKLRVCSCCNIEEPDSINFVFDYDEKVIEMAPILMAFENFISDFVIDG